MTSDSEARRNAQSHATAYYLLEGLNEIGIDYLFCNFGTDHAPIIEELAQWKKAGRAVPKVLVCAHENVAVHMAAGYAMATGRGQAVLVHVDAGTSNAAMGMVNLFHTRLPVLLMAGRAPFTTFGELPGTRDNYVHFIQEVADQASVVRPYVKWEYTLPSGVTTKQVLRRAHSLMQSEPKGPVYLMLPREILTESWDEAAIRAFPADRFGEAASIGTDPQTIDGLATRLLAAERPILVTAYAGRNPESAAAVIALAEFAGIRVYESQTVSNVSQDSPCFAGFRPGKQLVEADLGLMVDVDVPWIPRDITDNPATYWAQIDVDVMKEASPTWCFPTNLRIQGDSGRVLTQLLDAVKARATPAFRQAAAKRVEVLAAEREVRLREAADLAEKKGKTGEINPHYVCAELGKALSADDIVVNEATRNAPAVSMQIPRSKPGTMVRMAGGGLGGSGGMALGVKLAHPDRQVVQVIGDGSFYFNNMSAVDAVSKQYHLPILTVVLDNAGWSAVKESTLRVYPKGTAKDENTFESLLAPDMDFAKMAQGAGGHGEKVIEPAEVPAAIQRCLAALRDGRSALLHVCVTHH